MTGHYLTHVKTSTIDVHWRAGGEQPKATFDTSVLLFLKQIVCHFIEQDNGR